jgi:hypothetical protein
MRFPLTIQLLAATFNKYILLGDKYKHRLLNGSQQDTDCSKVTDWPINDCRCTVAFLAYQLSIYIHILRVSRRLEMQKTCCFN